MSAAITQNAENSRQTEQMAVQSAEDARSSGSAVQETVDAMQTIADGTTSWLAANLGTIANQVATLGTVLLLGGFTTFYVLADDGHGWAWLTQALTDRRRTQAGVVAEASVHQLGGYLRSQTVRSAVNGVVAYLLAQLTDVIRDAVDPDTIGRWLWPGGFQHSVSSSPDQSVFLRKIYWD